MRKITFLLFSFVSFSSLIFSNIRGNFKNYILYRDANSHGKNSFIMYNSLRLIAQKEYNDQIILNASYELADQVVQQKTNGYFPNLFLENIFVYRLVDFNVTPISNKHFDLYQNLDRFFIGLNFDRADFCLGRQPIAFGVSKIVSPVDIIIPYAYYSIDTEYRIGVDAIRGTVSFSDLSNIDFGYVFGKNFDLDKSAAFIKYVFNINKTDIALLSIYFQDSYLLGGHIQRPIMDVGFWMEAAYVYAGGGNDIISAKNYFSLSSGIDYNFSSKIYSYLEYHYNGAGVNQKDDYYMNRYQIAYAKGSVYLLGKHYLAPGINAEITPLLNLNSLLLWNISDMSFTFDLISEYNAAENLYFDVNAIIGVGKPNTEFKIRPNRFYLSLRYYF